MRNREQMRQMILRGPDIHPGVNYIIRGDKRRSESTQEVGSLMPDSDATTLSVEETTMRPDLPSNAGTELPPRSVIKKKSVGLLSTQHRDNKLCC